MAGRGMAPKATRSRSTDAKARERELQRLADDGEVRGPDLPDGVLPDGEDWHSRTRHWWDTWRRSAQAQTFIDTDWDFLLDTALLHTIMWSKGRWEFASEVRLRAAKYGATPEDRMRLKLKVDAPGAAPPTERTTPQSVADRRKNIRVVGD